MNDITDYSVGGGRNPYLSPDEPTTELKEITNDLVVHMVDRGVDRSIDITEDVYNKCEELLEGFVEVDEIYLEVQGTHGWDISVIAKCGNHKYIGDLNGWDLVNRHLP